jgi:hypothetical protein
LKKRLIEDYFDLAKSTAMYVDRPNKHVSLIFERNRLISIGTNAKVKTHPLAKKYDYLFNNMHSELDAWIKIRKYKSTKLSLVNYHFNNRGMLKLSKPCTKCQSWVCTIFDEIIFSGDHYIVNISGDDYLRYTFHDFYKYNNLVLTIDYDVKEN